MFYFALKSFSNYGPESSVVVWFGSRVEWGGGLEGALSVVIETGTPGSLHGSSCVLRPQIFWERK